ncbi:MAG: CHC2 zinc finger domain-containing protein [Verrucomicrobiota bacterium]
MKGLSIDEAKERLRIPKLWKLLGLPGQPRESCHSPFREDKKASFSIYEEGRRYHDHATGEGGDAISFLSVTLDLSRNDACRRFMELADDNPSIVEEERYWREEKRSKSCDLPVLDVGTRSEVEQLARLRGLNVDGVLLARERGSLRFGEVWGHRCWIILDQDHLNAQARRLDGACFPAYRDKLSERKAHTLAGSKAAWPVGAREASRYEMIALVEGGADLLAAFYWINAGGWNDRVSAMAMLGASNSVCPDAVGLLAGRRVRIFPHLDEAGRSAAMRWARQLKAVGCDIDAFDFSGLKMKSGEPVNDLNDCAHVPREELRQLDYLFTNTTD